MIHRDHRIELTLKGVIKQSVGRQRSLNPKAHPGNVRLGKRRRRIEDRRLIGLGDRFLRPCLGMRHGRLCRGRSCRGWRLRQVERHIVAEMARVCRARWLPKEIRGLARRGVRVMFSIRHDLQPYHTRPGHNWAAGSDQQGRWEQKALAAFGTCRILRSQTVMPRSAAFGRNTPLTPPLHLHHNRAIAWRLCFRAQSAVRGSSPGPPVRGGDRGHRSLPGCPHPTSRRRHRTRNR